MPTTNTGVKLAKFSRGKGSEVLTYGMGRADFCPEALEMTHTGNRFTLVTPAGKLPLFSPLIGKVNVYNVLAACAAAFARGVSLDEISIGIAKLDRVPGRFERVDAGQPFAVVVDYAHTDDALRNLTRLAREFVTKDGGKGRVITLFGCGGDRDRAKRPLMGQAAGENSDFVVLTSDNPRSEDPIAIINDALTGLQRGTAKYVIEPDRHKAIAMAISEASAGDMVLLAGKGHERTQTTREGVFPFDDFEVAREELQKAGYRSGEATQ
jgi:UDP-N-acetylmuramoyl-L-alanyl-D-glutamate--2,6-diaminopimelate ligase